VLTNEVARINEKIGNGIAVFLFLSAPSLHNQIKEKKYMSA
jgi:hypothetical protein